MRLNKQTFGAARIVLAGWLLWVPFVAEHFGLTADAASGAIPSASCQAEDALSWLSSSPLDPTMSSAALSHASGNGTKRVSLPIVVTESAPPDSRVSLTGREVPGMLSAQEAPLRAPVQTSGKRLDTLARRAPLFVENLGQVDHEALFSLTQASQTVWVTRKGLVFNVIADASESPAEATPSAVSSKRMSVGAPRATEISRSAVTQELLGLNPQVTVEPDMQEPGVYNFLLGNDPGRWHTGARTYRMVTYRDAWPGIDVRVYPLNGGLENVYILRPQARPEAIRAAIRGAKALSIDADGALVIETASGSLTQRQPVAYQTIDGKRVEVPASFALVGPYEYTFRLGAYRADRPLVIDPVLLFSTYMGGIHDDAGQSIVLDAQGNAYVAGSTASENFPVSANAFQPQRKNLGFYVFDAFVSKFSPSGVLLYSTFVGGNDNDYPIALAVDSQGSAYVAGQTQSNDYPTTPGAFQRTFGGPCCDGFVSKLSPDGSSLVYSTYLGGGGQGFSNSGNDFVNAIAVDQNGHAYLGGGTGSPNFPVTPGAFQTSFPGGPNPSISYLSGFVAELSADGSSLVFSTFLGGAGNAFNTVQGLAVDASGRVYTGGLTGSANFPVTPGAFQPTFHAGGGDGFVSVLTGDGSGLVCSTFFGGNGFEFVKSLKLGPTGDVYLTGFSNSSDFPTTQGAYRTSNSGNTDLYVARMTPDCSGLMYATFTGPYVPSSGFLGDVDYGSGIGLAVDSAGNAYVAGDTTSTSYPTTTDALQMSLKGPRDGVVSKLDPTGSQLLYSTYLGGSGSDSANALDVDAFGNIYVVGTTNSLDFPITANAFQDTFAGGDRNDVFVAAIGTGAIATVTPSSGGNAGSVTLAIRGSGLQQGATVVLSSGVQAITASFAAVSDDGSAVVAVFDLAGAAPGVYNVTVTNPDSSAFSLPKAFTVVEGGAPNIFTALVGRPAIRVNTPTYFYVTVGNSGNVDAYFVDLWLFFPSNVTVTRAFETLTPPPIRDTIVDFSQVPDSFPVDGVDGVSALPFLLPVLPAGRSFSMPFLISSATAQPFTLQVSATGPWFTSATELLSASGQSTSLLAFDLSPAGLGQCYPDNYLGDLQQCLDTFAGFPPGCKEWLEKSTQITQMVELPIKAIGNMVNRAAAQAEDKPQQNLYPWPTEADWGKDILGAMAKCANDLSLDTIGNREKLLGCLKDKWLKRAGKDAAQYLKDLQDRLQKLCKGGGTAASSLSAFSASPLADPSGDTCSLPAPPDICSPSNSIGSIDPNDKSGPLGAGTEGWLPGQSPMSYIVSFENEPEATAPAQRVVITDQLDPETFDVTSLTLGPVSFGDMLVTPPLGVTNFSTTVDLGAVGSVSDLKVRVQGSLDPSTALLKWTLQAIDASTGLPPDDPLVGLLPPDTNPPAGDGTVTFTVMLRAGVANGTQISNQARVFFDQNAPIDTPTWTNTIAEPVNELLTVTPKSLSFRQEETVGGTGQPSPPKNVTLQNTQRNPETLFIQNIQASQHFVLVDPSQCVGIVLAPGDKCAFEVQFVPGAAGTLQGTVSITDNAAGSPQTVALKGTGKAGKLKFKPSRLSFSAQPVNTTSPPKTVTISNPGPLPIVMSGAAASSDFVVSGDSCTGVTLTAGGTCVVSVEFAPTTKGSLSGSLTVTDNSIPGAVKLSGIGE